MWHNVPMRETSDYTSTSWDKTVEERGGGAVVEVQRISERHVNTSSSTACLTAARQGKKQHAQSDPELGQEEDYCGLLVHQYKN